MTDDLEKKICRILKISPEEEVFMSTYNPLVFYARLIDAGVPKYRAKHIVACYEKVVYDSAILLIGEYGRKHDG